MESGEGLAQLPLPSLKLLNKNEMKINFVRFGWVYQD